MKVSIQVVVVVMLFCSLERSQNMMMMKKKKKHAGEYMGVQIVHALIFHLHFRRHLLSACLLLLFALFSFLSLPILNNPHTSLVHINAQKEIVFRVPIIDAVVAAYILNATLVVPTLDQQSFWKDASNFSEIFDVDHFITYLSKDVKIIKQLPKEADKIISARVPRKCDPECYRARILPVFDKNNVQAVQLTKFDFRLSNWLDVDLQKLRCRVNYHALRFTDPILEMGRELVQRMRMKNKHFIALHLRFEPDMLAFSGCYYGGGEKEIEELSAIRKRWTNLHRKDPEKERRHGKCPLSPEEVGLMLRGLGYGNDVDIYVASGQVYGGEETLAPLKSLFPNLHTKQTIATKEELAQFSSYSSRMAALDFIVSDQSDVFVTNNNGNMAKILAGRRRYFGHKPTIRPNTRKLSQLFLNRDNLTWEEFASRVRQSQKGLMGEANEVKPGRGQFHEYPLSCICQNFENINNNNKEGEDQVLSEYEQDSVFLLHESELDDEVFSDYTSSSWSY